ncbi:MAG TPA: hypothetical protein VFB13_04000 [Reyranella sp.]|jgi:tetratricopeptide (TPR) repeat protein|nr:hypothetical protein [Reyranella sp.]
MLGQFRPGIRRVVAIAKKSKDTVTVVLSVAAFAISVFTTFKSDRRAEEERNRVTRGQLTEVLSKYMSSQVDAAKAIHDAGGNFAYQQQLQGMFNQQTGFLVDQASYLADLIPNLVTAYEFNTIAMANSGVSNNIAAEKYAKRAIAAATTDLYRAEARRAYAVFLFQQQRADEARREFRDSFLSGADALSLYTNGNTYEIWATQERIMARAPQTANELYDKAVQEYEAIDIDVVRKKALADLAVRRAGEPFVPPSTPAIRPTSSPAKP